MSCSCSMIVRATFTGAIGAGFPANGLLSRRRYCPIASDGSRTSASVATVTLQFERRIVKHSNEQLKRPGGATTGRHHGCTRTRQSVGSPEGGATGTRGIPRGGVGG